MIASPPPAITTSSSGTGVRLGLDRLPVAGDEADTDDGHRDERSVTQRAGDERPNRVGRLRAAHDAPKARMAISTAT